MSVAYPFAVLKPSGAQGDVTLHDINQRILSSPDCSEKGVAGARKKKKRSVNNRPSSSSSSSVGALSTSGRAVVALTTIHTQGKGTITIMRTRAA